MASHHPYNGGGGGTLSPGYYPISGSPHGHHLQSQHSSLPQSPEPLYASSPSEGNSNPHQTSINAYTEVFDPEFKYIYDVPNSCVVHLPPARLNITRLVLCRNYTAHEPSSCGMGHNCKFVHADCAYEQLEAHPIHVNYIWRNESLCTYQRLSDALREDRAANGNGKSPAAGEGTVLDVLQCDGSGPVDRIPATRLLVTLAVEHLFRRGPQPVLMHCESFSCHRMCKAGELCRRVHALYVDPNIRTDFKRAPARKPPLASPKANTAGPHYTGLRATPHSPSMNEAPSMGAGWTRDGSASGQAYHARMPSQPHPPASSCHHPLGPCHTSSVPASPVLTQGAFHGHSTKGALGSGGAPMGKPRGHVLYEYSGRPLGGHDQSNASMMDSSASLPHFLPQAAATSPAAAAINSGDHREDGTEEASSLTGVLAADGSQSFSASSSHLDSANPAAQVAADPVDGHQRLSRSQISSQLPPALRGRQHGLRPQPNSSATEEAKSRSDDRASRSEDEHVADGSAQIPRRCASASSVSRPSTRPASRASRPSSPPRLSLHVNSNRSGAYNSVSFNGLTVSIRTSHRSPKSAVARSPPTFSSPVTTASLSHSMVERPQSAGTWQGSYGQQHLRPPATVAAEDRECSFSSLVGDQASPTRAAHTAAAPVAAAAAAEGWARRADGTMSAAFYPSSSPSLSVSFHQPAGYDGRGSRTPNDASKHTTLLTSAPSTGEAASPVAAAAATTTTTATAAAAADGTPKRKATVLRYRNDPYGLCSRVLIE